jgi:type VI secretion system secreted protein Hcp
MAMTDYFLKIDGIAGESTDEKHANEIDLLSFSWGASQQGTSHMGGGMGAGKVSFQDFHFTMKVGKASPLLFLSCSSGKHIPSALLTVREAGGKQQEYLKVKFTDLLISSYTSGGSGGVDIKPVDSVSFNFSKIEWDYKPQDKAGNLGGAVTAGWDLKKNVKV